MSDGYVGMFNYPVWGADYAADQNCSTDAEDTGAYANAISFPSVLRSTTSIPRKNNLSTPI